MLEQAVKGLEQPVEEVAPGDDSMLVGQCSERTSSLVILEDGLHTLLPNGRTKKRLLHCRLFLSFAKVKQQCQSVEENSGSCMHALLVLPYFVSNTMYIIAEFRIKRLGGHGI
mmetsp:Transcript_27907/g.46157  ORF Transcript_27907/g.46157 Transcript_27907/m.46157 type:complete len:113 (+) Transcript_27907:138-476(+)